MFERQQVFFKCPQCGAVFRIVRRNLDTGGRSIPIDSRDQVMPEPRRFPIEVAGRVCLALDGGSYRVGLVHTPCGFEGWALPADGP